MSYRGSPFLWGGVSYLFARDTISVFKSNKKTNKNKAPQQKQQKKNKQKREQKQAN